jgi:hypothetical protein
MTFREARYQVVQSGKVVASFDYFFDAWIYASQLKSCSRIKGWDGEWQVDPAYNPTHPIH